MSNENHGPPPGPKASRAVPDAMLSGNQICPVADGVSLTPSPVPGPSLEPKLICYCYPTTVRQIEFLVRHQGVRTLSEVKALTGAATGCMGCEAEVEALLSALLNG